MEFPDNLRYSKEHEWVAVDGSRARVGITDYAQDALGDIVYVQLPTVGKAVEAMATCAEVESTKSVSDIYAPVSGTITAVNEALNDSPELVNQEPYGVGWIFEVDLSDPSQIDSLLDARAYRALVESG
ncbi:MAG: glycine cleavage system protein GcvH [Acidimicrobiia bacterium]